jgi:predicted CoA-binding protein
MTHLLVTQFLRSDNFIVFGASTNRSKIGNHVLRFYQDRKMPVFPIHRTEASIEGSTCFKSLDEVFKANPHVNVNNISISFITPPHASLEAVQQIFTTHFVTKNLWFQPGIYSICLLNLFYLTHNQGQKIRNYCTTVNKITSHVFTVDHVYCFKIYRQSSSLNAFQQTKPHVDF